MCRWWAVALTGLLLFGSACSRPAADSVARPPVTASSAALPRPDNRVGAVFLEDTSIHVCSGSVLDSAAGDLVLTAAHCMADGVAAYFIPGFEGDADAQRHWNIDAVYLDPRWVAHQDPLADFAIARVTGDAGSVEAHAGGGFELGSAPKPGTMVSVSGYVLGTGGGQLGCQARTSVHGPYPSVSCAGLTDGTSGSPWVVGSAVTGVIGGWHGGGCEQDVSYSPPFDDTVAALLRRAEAGGPGDAAPTDLDDGC